jgi:hypothetical protein
MGSPRLVSHRHTSIIDPWGQGLNEKYEIVEKLWITLIITFDALRTLMGRGVGKGRGRSLERLSEALMAKEPRLGFLSP